MQGDGQGRGQLRELQGLGGGATDCLSVPSSDALLSSGLAGAGGAVPPRAGRFPDSKGLVCERAFHLQTN